jgi:uncharacterized protein (DUF1501 family)
MISRRAFLTGSMTVTLLGSPIFSSLAAKRKKYNLIVISLRGGMDGLSAVPPIDPVLEKFRPDILVRKTLPLTSEFSLHPSLKNFHNAWKQNQAAIVHSTNIPYTMRSHFEGQDLMESGGHKPFAEYTGWLGRGIETAGLEGLAIALPMPLILRSKANLDNYFPTKLSTPSSDIIRQIAETYPQDSNLRSTIERVIMRPSTMLSARRGSRQAYRLAATAGKALAKDNGPRVAVFDINGFDTHAAQGGSNGEHADKLYNLDRIFGKLRESLGSTFDNTLIVTLTEFGRKVEQNGGNGTEHGYGTAVLMMGGLVKKAQVYSNWPGLKKKNMFEGQDLNATIDARSIYCSAMATTFNTDFEKLKRQVFWNDPLENLQDKLFRI